MPKIRKILFPTDFSPCSRVAEEYAVSFARDHDASLIVLHVIEDIYLTEEAWEPLVLHPDLFTEIETRATNNLENMISSIRKKSVRVTKEIRRGKPFAEIIRTAREENVDLLIMGTHGRAGLRHALIGSTAEKVVRKSPVPVLTIRCTNKKFRMP